MFIFERPQKDFTGSFAGGIASFGELFDAVVQQMGVVENLNAVQMALEDAYDVRIDAIFAATGVRIEHPFRQNDVGESEMPLGGERQNEMDAFEQSRARLAAQFPQHAEVIGAGSSIRAEADAISVAAEDRTNLLVSSRDDFFVKWGAILASGIIGSFRDPVQAATLVFGGGPGAGRTIAARVLNVAAKEFAVNVGIEAALQPIVQKYRADLGLEHGFADAARQVAFAGVLGAAFGSVVQGGVEVVSRVGRQRAIARQFSAAANELPETSPFAEIDTLSGQATSSLLEPVRVAINAEGRGAIDLIDAERAFDDYRVAGVNAEEFDLAAAAGIRFAETRTIRRALPISNSSRPISRRPDIIACRRLSSLAPTICHKRSFLAQSAPLTPIWRKEGPIVLWNQKPTRRRPTKAYSVMTPGRAMLSGKQLKKPTRNCE